MQTAVAYSKSLDEAVASMIARGCVIEVNPCGLVKVRGGCNADELAQLQSESTAVRGILEALTTPETAQPDDEVIQDIVNRWRESCTPERGYDWSTRNWLTVYLFDVLVGTMYGWEKAECSLHEVHDDFKKWAEAHKTNYTVTVNGVRKRTVTPQIQPKADDFTRMLRYLGTTFDEYYNKVKPTA